MKTPISPIKPAAHTDSKEPHGGSPAQSPAFCRDHRGTAFSFESFLEKVRDFHGHAAPGLILGGRMVTRAMENLPSGILFDAVCETGNCLPDAVQLLTPCTIGNGWLRVIFLGRYALSLYDKYSGEGVRVYVDGRKLEGFDQIRSWFLKLVPKAEQDRDALFEQIRNAGDSILSMEKVRIRPEQLGKSGLGPRRLCPLCHEFYPARHGALCRACQGESPYLDADPKTGPMPRLDPVPLERAKGHRALHDMTEIIPGKSKGPAVFKGQTIKDEDLCRLQRMGRRYIYLEKTFDPGPDWVHENDAALAFAKGLAGDGICFSAQAKEGKINLKAAADGLFVVDTDRLEAFNLLGDVMCAARKNHSVVRRSMPVAGTRAIPLYLSRSVYLRAISILEPGPVFRIVPMRKAKVGVLVTGTEVFEKRVQDRFVPIIRGKVEDLGAEVIQHMIVPDDREKIASGIASLLEAGADLLITTAGLSVDPDDVTRKGILDAGAKEMLYGAPVLPGAMTLLAKIDKVPLLGVPACALYFKTTSLDIFLPRLLAGLDITRKDLARMGNGAFCLGCKVCTYPKCSFGK